MKKIMISGILLIGGMVSAQTAITFNGCHNLFEDQNFLFSNTGTDSFSKRIYITTPVDGDQSCGGIGTCEFKIQWNNALTRWEFLADSGNGDFVDPFLIYYNATGNSAATNPPGNTFGTWVENTDVTEGACGGNLSAANSVFTGDLHSSSLATGSAEHRKVQLFPNPVTDFIGISGVESAQSVQIFNAAGQLVQTEKFSERMNVSTLKPGVYILRIVSPQSDFTELKFIKK
ncbi:hypothetical protein FIC_00393 [Flavobacteriaceae bacterium 3519-10]|nr:hypothetical protein FIC_00393 [Flavobacteriaceae bacterium 3519-10]